MRRYLFFGILFIAALASRLAHSAVVWVEEGYPIAAALQMMQGKTLYRDIWFDKPPLFPVLYLLWGAQTGWPLRVAGALFVLLVAGLIFLVARRIWGEREAYIAAALMTFFLIFETPSALLPLAPDLLTLPFALLAVWLATGRRPLACGLVAGAAMFVNTKAFYIVAVCALWLPMALPPLGAGFVAAQALGAGWLAATGSLGAYWKQVWEWGFVYARNTFVQNPLLEGLRRTANWAGFHAALIIPAIWFFRKERYLDMVRLAFWALAALAMAWTGLRFFPRYYFALLPPLVLAASRGIVLLGRRRAVAVAMAVLLLVPLVRFGPRYLTLAYDLLTGRQLHRWGDLTLFNESLITGLSLQRRAQPGDTLFVWGYRPDVYAISRIPAGTRFLDSQPLSGVPADRHLTETTVLDAAMAAANRRELSKTSPTWIVDGLGNFNPKLVLENYPDLGQWLSRYDIAGTTGSIVVYHLRPTSFPANGDDASRETR